MQGEILVIPTNASMNSLKKSAQVLAKYLVKSGIALNEQISLCPDRRRLQHAVSKALGRSEVVFTLGGMGKDSGFLAKQVISDGLGLPLENSREALIAIREYSTRTGIASSADDVTLASLPSGSRPLIPAHGVIPGCIISSPSQHIVMLPENQEELVPMLTRQVLPLLARVGLSVESSHELRTYGASEEQVRHLILDLMGTTNPVVTTRAQGDEVVVKVVANAANSTDAVNLSSPVLRSIANRIGDYAYGLDVANLETALVQKMNRKELTLSVAESGTSGKLVNRISSVDGNKSVLIGTITADDAESKLSSLSIRKKDIRKKGEVSEYMAVAMASAVREQTGSDIGVGITANLPDYTKGEDSIAYVAVCDNKYVYIKKILVEEDNISSIGTIIDAAVSRGLNMTRLFVDYLPHPYSGSVPLSKALTGKVSVTDKEAYSDLSEFEAEGPEFEYDDNEPKIKAKIKKTRKKGKVRKFVLILAVVLFLGGATYLGLYTVQSIMARSLRDNLAEVYDTTGFNGLHSLNPDAVAFVSIKDTEMRYPIVQSTDNQYYLRRDFNKKANNHGVPFMDYQNDARKPSDNLIVYGHNMRDGQIFGELLKYKEVEYYKEHPIIEFDTTKKKGDYKVFAVFITSAEPKHFDDGKVFEYHKFIDGATDDEFNAFIAGVKIRSLLNLPVDVEPNDEIITLSTCDYDFSDSRFVVMARRVRSDESVDFDTSSAEKNPKPLYPDIWYKTYGYNGEKPSVIDWTPPVSERSVESKIESSVESSTTDEQSKAEKSVENSAERSASKTDDTKLTEEKKKAEEAAAAKAAEEKKKADEAAATKAAEEKKKADEAAATKAAEEKKKADEEAVTKAAEAKTKAEEEAVAQAGVASLAAEDAASYQRSAQNAETKSAAEAHAESAKTAATKAEDAATKAKTAAETAGTDKAKTAAAQASASAINARQSANTATENTKGINEGLDGALVANPSGSTVKSATTNSSSGNLKVKSSTSFDPDDDIDIVARIVQQEVGSSFHTEAIKAQAVATHSYIASSNAKGTIPTVYMAKSVDAKVKSAVSEIIGQNVYYNGKIAHTTYYATSAGVTTSSYSVWGGHYPYPYLVSVDSSVDTSVKGYKVTITMTSDEVASRISQKTGIETSGDPSTWFEILSYEDGQYNGNMAICGYTKSAKTGSVLTGRLIRETVLNLRSSAFTIEYDYNTDTFSFTTYGFGHGVGMSQTGANAYAKQGWNYVNILEHYYPGTNVG